MRIVSLSMMALSLMAQGAYFWIRDWVTPDPLPFKFFLSDAIWLVALCSLAAYKRFPWITLACSWGLALTVMVVYWPHHSYYGAGTMLRIVSPSLINLLFAHLILRLRGEKSVTDG